MHSVFKQNQIDGGNRKCILVQLPEIISEKDLHMLSPGDGFKWADRGQIVGKKALVDIPANEVIYAGMIQ